MHAELDPASYPANIKISDAQMDSLPLHRHGWHGDWNYTLRPELFERIDTTRVTPVAFDTPSPRLAWLAHPAITGMTDTDWTALIARLLPLHKQLREDKLHRQRGGRPRISGEGVATGRPASVTLPDQLLAAVLHYRLALPQIAIAVLFGLDPGTVNRRIRDLRQLLEQDGTVIQPAQTRLQTLDDLHEYTRREGITHPAEIKPAC